MKRLGVIFKIKRDEKVVMKKWSMTLFRVPFFVGFGDENEGRKWILEE